MARVAAAEDKRRADEQAAREFEEEPLVLPPEPDDPTTLSLEDDTHAPSGELHNLPPKSEEPEPEGDDMGGVPMPVPTSYVHAGDHGQRDQAEFEEPEDPSELPEPPAEFSDARKQKPKGQVIPQPTAISLNEE